MGSIKVVVYGWDGFTCQIPRIKEAMINHGHILSENSPDLIYCNDPIEFQKAINLKKKISKCFFNTKYFRYPLAFSKYK